MRAASNSSSLTLEIYCRIKKMPKALAAPGTTNGHIVSTHLNQVIMTNKGTIVTVNGMIKVARRKANNTSFAGKLYFAKPKPASELKNRFRRDARIEIRIVLPRTRKMFRYQNNST